MRIWVQLALGTDQRPFLARLTLGAQQLLEPVAFMNQYQGTVPGYADPEALMGFAGFVFAASNNTSTPLVLPIGDDLALSGATAVNLGAPPQLASIYFGFGPPRPPFWSVWASSNNNYFQQVGPVGGTPSGSTIVLPCGTVQFDDVEVLPPDAGDRALLAMQINAPGAACGSLVGGVLREIEADGTAYNTLAPTLGRFAVGANPVSRRPYQLGRDAANGALELSRIELTPRPPLLPPPLPPPLLRLVAPGGPVEPGDVTGSFNPSERPFFTAVISGAAVATVTDSDGGVAAVNGLDTTALAVVGAGWPAMLRVLGPTVLPAQRMPVVGVQGGVVVLWRHRMLGPVITFVEENGTLRKP